MHKSRASSRVGFWAARLQYDVRYLNQCFYSTLKEKWCTENDGRQIKRPHATIQMDRDRNWFLWFYLTQLALAAACCSVFEHATQ